MLSAPVLICARTEDSFCSSASSASSGAAVQSVARLPFSSLIWWMMVVAVPALAGLR